MESDLGVGSMTIRSILSNKDFSHLAKDKEKDFYDVYADASAAFLGPSIWDKTLPEFKMDYLDLDALLNGSGDDGQQKVAECNGLNNNEKIPHHHHLHHHHIHHHQQYHHQQHQSQHHHMTTQDGSNPTPVTQSSRHLPSESPSPVSSTSMSETDLDNRRLYAIDCKFSPTDLALATPPGQDEHYDPTSAVFPDEELKPQPIIKKSRKNFVPDSLKDDKYWARRQKNNIAAKRSREARRLKENQIVLRASYLEKENNSLKEDVMRLKAENDMLRNQLKEFQS